MIQNSRSPVVKSRISSSSGKTMSVEKRSLAWTATMSSLLYFTTRAPSSAANVGGKTTTASAAIRAQARVSSFRAIFVSRDFIGSSPCRGLVLLRIPVAKPLRNRLNEQPNCGEDTGYQEGNENGVDAESSDHFRQDRNHARPPAK